MPTTSSSTSASTASWPGPRPSPPAARPDRALHPGLWLGALFAVVMVAVGFRLYALDSKSLWLDEVIQASQANYATLGDVIARTRIDDQMPLLNSITWLMRSVLPNDVVLRLPSVIAGVLAVVGLFLLGTVLFGRRVGLLAALLMAVWPFAVGYSQEARPYTLLMAATCFQMYFAYQVVRRRALLDALGLAIASLVTVYSHYMGLAATAAAAVFVGGWLALDGVVALLQPPRARAKSVRAFLDGAVPAVIAAGIILVGYLPWARTLRAFLRRPTVGFGRYVGQPHHLSLADLQAFLQAFDVTGLVVVLITVGVIWTIWWALHDRLHAATLLAAWLLVPLLGLGWKLRGSIALLLPRYFIFLLPAGILLCAIGIDALARLLARERLWARAPTPHGFTRWRATVLAAILSLLALVLLVPPTVAAYAVPKDDYRDATNLIVDSSPPDSVILGLGPFSDYITISMAYYLQSRRSPILLVDGSYLDDRSAARIEASHGSVWGALYTGYLPTVLDHTSVAGLEVHRFPGVTLVREGSAPFTAAQASALLRWATTFEPRDQASVDYLAMIEGSTAGATPLFGKTELTELRAAGGQVDATPIAIPVSGGEDLVLQFAYRNANFSGQQVLLISATNAQGQTIQEFPTGQGFPQINGYQCAPAPVWTSGAFAFAVPSGATSLTLWQRATGTGLAEFSAVSLLRLS